MNYFADGSDLRTKREDRCLSLADLSALSGVSKGSIGNFETGARGLSRKAQKALYDALVIGKPEKQSIADGEARNVCLQCVSKDKEIADLQRQLASANETIHNLSVALAQGRITDQRGPPSAAQTVHDGGTRRRASTSNERRAEA